MSLHSIQVQGVSKRYELGETFHNAFRDRFDEWMKSVFTKSWRTKKIREMIWALRDISFSAESGEIIGVIGRNGSGKSTLLKILSRITSPTLGRVVLKGRVASLLEVGTGFHPELTGRENIYLNGSILGMRKFEIDRQFDEIVSFAEIENFLNTPVKRYSSGMYVRLAFAVAAHLHTEILLVDEVLAVGDVNFQTKCIGKMGTISGSGKTIIFVSHNLTAVQNLCHRVLILDKGSLVKDAKPAPAIEHYLNLVKASRRQLLDEIPQREGTGEFRFSKIWITDESKKEVTRMKCGGRYNIHTIVRPTGLTGVKNRCVVTLVILDNSNSRLSSLSSQEIDIDFELIGETCLIWNIDHLPLSPGHYFISLHLSQLETKVPIDFVPGSVSFEVEPGDFYGTGRTIRSEKDIMLIPFSFQHFQTKGS